MSIETKLVKCEPDNPNRCQANAGAKVGQCPFLSLEGIDAEEYAGIKYCPRHGGNSVGTMKRKSANSYRVGVWQARLDEFSEHEDVNSLKGEIGVLRLMLEETLVKCTDSTELYINSGRISELASKIQKLVDSSSRLEKSMGMLMDKTAALNFAGSVVEIISKHISDAEVIDKISNDIIDVLGSITK